MEIKESSVKLAIESVQAIAYTARELGTYLNSFCTWISKYSKNP
jgi:transposase-like protein